MPTDCAKFAGSIAHVANAFVLVEDLHASIITYYYHRSPVPDYEAFKQKTAKKMLSEDLLNAVSAPVFHIQVHIWRRNRSLQTSADRLGPAQLWPQSNVLIITTMYGGAAVNNLLNKLPLANNYPLHACR